MRTNLRPSARAIDCPRLVLPTPGGPTKQRIGSRAARSAGVSLATFGSARARSRPRRRPRRRRWRDDLLVSWAARVLAQLAHRQVLEDAVLDLLQVVVVLVEDLPRPGDVDLAAAQLVPGQARHPVEIGADDAVLRRGRRDRRQPLQLALRLAPRLLRQRRPPRSCAAARPISRSSLLLAQLLLDRAQLLAQEVLALRLRHPLLGFGGDLLPQLAHRLPRAGASRPAAAAWPSTGSSSRISCRAGAVAARPVDATR